MTSTSKLVPHTNLVKEGSSVFHEHFLTQHHYHPGPITAYLFAESREQYEQCNSTKANSNGENVFKMCVNRFIITLTCF